MDGVGLVVSSVPITIDPSRRNCTPATPTLSLATADTVTAVPETVLPFAGAVSTTLFANQNSAKKKFDRRQTSSH